MRWYADLPAVRARQVTADAVWLVLVAASVLLGRAVAAAVSALAEPARGFTGGARDLARQLDGAGESAADVPLVGDELAGPLQRAAEGATSLAEAGQQQVDAVTQLATVLGVATAAVPIVLVTLLRLVPRRRWQRRADETRRLAATAGGERLLALRALHTRSAAELLDVHPDPAGGWAREDPVAVRALADLQLRAAGLRPRGTPR
ncbi:hypothetical protein MO973_05950 [Paenibacillus sp. TRM 82003]|uniref:hypothetical protein n=1 Tax=Kineococcus sp. TRM81007 TaxID=2925831 RepID=UPI001F5A1266|nr:hypothetical protein [Kineococcus sp. TRM81007]MCI2237423.1 hypothetical protein [Kineococcus sp. TRM81007]MCI3919774.1 hypothetical protein [Paenibacillus sp. TRM 82003]